MDKKQLFYQIVLKLCKLLFYLQNCTQTVLSKN